MENVPKVKHKKSEAARIFTLGSQKYFFLSIKPMIIDKFKQTSQACRDTNQALVY